MSTEAGKRLGNRFWSKVLILGPRDCWPWTGSTMEGYGQYFLGGESRLAHRLAYEELVGPIPEGLTIDHPCRTRGCINPAHMEPVTGAENTRRGESPSAIHGRKTACPKGHPYSPENTYPKPRGGRECRICRTAQQAVRRGQVATEARAAVLRELREEVAERLTPHAPSDLSLEDFTTRDTMEWSRDLILAAIDRRLDDGSL